MKVRVLFFSLLRDVTGEEEIEFDLPGNPFPLSQLLALLFEKYAGLKDWDEKLLIAVNCEYAERQAAVKPGDEIAIMPPVQGG